MLAWIKNMTAGQGVILFLLFELTGFVLAIIYPAAPFTIYSGALVTSLGGFILQRLAKDRMAARANGCPPPANGKEPVE